MPMCSPRIIDLRLANAYYDCFDSDDESSDPNENEHRAIFECSGYERARDLFRGPY